MPKKIRVFTIACMALLICTQAFAENKRVMFFEAALAPTDTIFSAEPSGFSILAEVLRDEGMLVASMSSGWITREKLVPYDIVVLHPSFERPLEAGEISALVWFVAQKGGALFVHGGTAKVVNPLIEVFGISMDTSNLIDTSSALDDSADGRQFVLTQFPGGSGFESQNLNKIGFYGGAPLVLSQDAVAIVTGDEDCYSANGLYSIGSSPPVAAVAYLGRGIIMVKSNRTILNNGNIGAYQNTDWAKAVFGRLASAQETEVERDQSLFGLRSRVAELEKTMKVSAEKLNKYEDDLKASYEKTKDLQKENRGLEKKSRDLETQLETAQNERDKLNETLAKYRNPETLKVVGVAAAVVLLVIFIVGLFFGRWTVRDRG